MNILLLSVFAPVILFPSYRFFRKDGAGVYISIYCRASFSGFLSLKRREFGSYTMLSDSAFQLKPI